MKVSVSNFKVEKSENLYNAFYVFWTWHFKNNVKSRVFWILKKKTLKMYSRTMLTSVHLQ